MVVVVVVVVVVVDGGQGFGEQLPDPWAIPPWAWHCTGVSTMQVSKAPIGDDCTQHWIVVPHVPNDFLVSLTHTPLQQLW